MTRRRLLAAAFAWSFMPWRAWSAGDPAAALAALRLATLAERMAKLHAQATHGILPERSRRGIAEAVREFETQLKRLRARPGSAESRENALLLAVLWDEHRAWVVRAPTREHMRKLSERTEEVAWLAEKAARLAEPAASKALDAQRAAMLSQRLPRLHLVRRAGDEGTRERDAAEEQLRRVVALLARGEDAPAEALAELQLVDNQLQFLVRATAERESGPRRLEFIAKAGDHLMESLARLARLYEGSAAS
jgi:hypothetical protein